MYVLHLKSSIRVFYSGLRAKWFSTLESAVILGSLAFSMLEGSGTDAECRQDQIRS